MSTSGIEVRAALAKNVTAKADALTVELSDGRTISVPSAWYPRLVHATDEERGDWRLIGGGEGIHWPRLDEDLSVEGLLAGRGSGESAKSLEKWLRARTSVQGRGRKRRAS